MAAVTLPQTLAEALDAYPTCIQGELSGEYQHEGVRWMLGRELGGHDTKGGLLADEMGLGKTYQLITVVRANPVPTLIVVPLATMAQWRDAIYDFGGVRPIVVMNGCGNMQRLPAEASIVLTSYSVFQQGERSPPPACLMQKHWGRVVLDEAHVMRNRKTQLFKQMSTLTADIKWGLTGTPIQNKLRDLLTLVSWIGYTGDTKTFTEEYVLRRTQEGEAGRDPALALPKLVQSIQVIDFANETEKRLYEVVKEKSAELIKRGKDKNAKHFAALEALLRCRQICVHPEIYLESMLKRSRKRVRAPEDGQGDDDSSSSDEESDYVGRRNKRVCDWSKETRLPSVITDILKDAPPIVGSKMRFLVGDLEKHVKEHKCLVFCQFRHEMQILEDMLGERNIAAIAFNGKMNLQKKEVAISNFVNSSVPVMILQINCGAVGLNLQVASRVYTTSPHWNPCVEAQAVCRAHRKFQTRQVTFVRLIMRGSVEERCLEVQLEKAKVIKATLNDDSLGFKLGMDGDAAAIASHDIMLLLGAAGQAAPGTASKSAVK